MGRVNEVDASLNHPPANRVGLILHQSSGLGILSGVDPERHDAEAHLRDKQACLAKKVIAHDRLLVQGHENEADHDPGHEKVGSTNKAI